MNKPETTAELKARFFAQYAGLNIFRQYEQPPCIRWRLAPYQIANFYLELRDLRQITDEEAIEVAKIRGSVNIGSVEFTHDGYWVHHNGGVSKFVFMMDLTIPQGDYLRSRGFLLPFMEYSCEEIIEMGWAKYKE